MDFKVKLQHFTQDIPKNPDHHNPSLNLIIASYKAQKLDEALEYCLQGIEFAPRNHHYYAWAGMILFDMGCYIQAKYFYHKAQEYHPAPNEIYNLLQMLYQWLQDMEMAKHYLIKRMDSNDAGHLMTLGVYQMQIGNLAKAKRHFLKALQLQPSKESINYFLGILYSQKGDYRKAKSYFFKQLEMYKNQNNSSCYGQLANIYQKCQQFDKAERYLKKAIESRPQNAKFYYSLAKLLTRSDRYIEAIDYLLKSLNKGPQRKAVELLFELLPVKMKKESFTNRSLLCKKIINLNPSISKAYYRLASILSLQPPHSEIVTVLLKGLELDLKSMWGFYHSILLKPIKNKNKIQVFLKYMILVQAYTNMGKVLFEVKKYSLAQNFFTVAEVKCKKAEKQIQNNQFYIAWLTQSKLQ